MLLNVYIPLVLYTSHLKEEKKKRKNYYKFSLNNIIPSKIENNQIILNSIWKLFFKGNSKITLQVIQMGSENDFQTHLFTF